MKRGILFFVAATMFVAVAFGQVVDTVDCSKPISEALKADIKTAYNNQGGKQSFDKKLSAPVVGVDKIVLLKNFYSPNLKKSVDQYLCYKEGKVYGIYLAEGFSSLFESGKFVVAEGAKQGDPVPANGSAGEKGAEQMQKYW